MEPLLIVLSLVVAVALFVLGVPIVLCMGLWIAIVSPVVGFSLDNIGQTAFQGLNSFAILAVPLFIFTGDLILAGGIARRLAAFALAILGWLRGALLIATLLASGLFAAISGSNAATTATFTRIMYGEMVRRGVDRTFAAATTATGGTLGVVIPPSVSFIFWGVLFSQPIGDLFLAGIIPGALMALAMGITAYCVARKRQYPRESGLELKRLTRTGWGALHGFIAIAVTLVGAYSGIYSPTEAAAVAVVYCACAGIFATREFRLRDLPAIMHRSAVVIGLIGPIAAFSIVFQQTVSILGASEFFGHWLLGIESKWLALALIMCIILINGTVFESLPNIVMLGPIVVPVAYELGIDPIHFAVIFVLGDTIGFITPPYGLNLYVASGMTGIPYLNISLTAVRYYMIPLVIVWILVAAFPTLSLLFVPNR
jgi:C4-dicarboxylate transporter DctM subunit